MRLFRRRKGPVRIDTATVTEDAAQSLRQAEQDLDEQKRKLRAADALHRRYDRIVADNHLAELVYQAFTARHGEGDR